MVGQVDHEVLGSWVDDGHANANAIILVAGLADLWVVAGYWGDGTALGLLG